MLLQAVFMDFHSIESFYTLIVHLQIQENTKNRLLLILPNAIPIHEPEQREIKRGEN